MMADGGGAAPAAPILSGQNISLTSANTNGAEKGGAAAGGCCGK
jgi:hypothetical protein